MIDPRDREACKKARKKYLSIVNSLTAQPFSEENLKKAKDLNTQFSGEYGLPALGIFDCWIDQLYKDAYKKPPAKKQEGRELEEIRSTSKIIKAYSPKERHDYLMKQKCVPLDKTLNRQLLLVVEDSAKIPKALYDYKCWQGIDYMQYRYLKKYGYKDMKLAEEMELHIKDIIEKHNSLFVEFTTLQFRKKLGKVKSMHNVDVYLLYEKLFRENIMLDTYKYLPEDNKIIGIGRLIGLADYQWIGERPREKNEKIDRPIRFHTRKVKYTLRIEVNKSTVLGQMALRNLLLGQYYFIGTGFYKLDGSIQMVLRVVFSSSKKNPTFFDEDLLKIAGIKDKDIKQARETLEKGLRKAEKDHFLRGFTKHKKAGKIEYKFDPIPKNKLRYLHD